MFQKIGVWFYRRTIFIQWRNASLSRRSKKLNAKRRVNLHIAERLCRSRCTIREVTCLVLLWILPLTKKETPAAWLFRTIIREIVCAIWKLVIHFHSTCVGRIDHALTTQRLTHMPTYMQDDTHTPHTFTAISAATMNSSLTPRAPMRFQSKRLDNVIVPRTI